MTGEEENCGSFNCYDDVQKALLKEVRLSVHVEAFIAAVHMTPRQGILVFVALSRSAILRVHDPSVHI